MKAIVFGVVAIFAVAQGSVVQLLPASTATLVRTPSFDSAVVHSQRLGGGFSYSTLENHAYAPVVHSVRVWIIEVELICKRRFFLFQVPLYHYNVYPQYHPQFPQVYYPAQHPIYSVHPSYIPSFGGVPLPAAPGVNPQNPIEVESPADNQGGDEDTVSVESA